VSIRTTPALFAATILAAAAATSNAVAAFVVLPPPAARYTPEDGPFACGAGTCRVLLEPMSVVDLTGTAYVLPALNAIFDVAVQRTGYLVNPFGQSLDINFQISRYQAYHTATMAGGRMYVDYTPQMGAVLPAGLHWIQIVSDNYNLSGVYYGNLRAPRGPGNPENVVDGPPRNPTPYYDFGAPATAPPSFTDNSQRPFPTAANPLYRWNADLFLVSQTGMIGATRVVTIYDAVQWGWVSQYTGNGVFGAIPEPGTWSLLLAGSAMLGAALRRRAKQSQAATA
jgi:hypothetical protein